MMAKCAVMVAVRGKVGVGNNKDGLHNDKDMLNNDKDGLHNDKDMLNNGEDGLRNDEYMDGIEATDRWRVVYL
jgi:hypothetical protein